MKLEAGELRSVYEVHWDALDIIFGPKLTFTRRLRGERPRSSEPVFGLRAIPGIYDVCGA